MATPTLKSEQVPARPQIIDYLALAARPHRNGDDAAQVRTALTGAYLRMAMTRGTVAP